MLEGIETCRRMGYGPIKINAVAVKNLVEPDIVPLARFGRERGIEIRYIEFMPLDAQGLWLRDKVLTADEMIAMLEREIGPLEEIPDRDPRAPATEYRFADGVGTGGIYRLGNPAVLFELQPPPADRRRQDPLLPVCDRGDRCARRYCGGGAIRTTRSPRPIRGCVEREMDRAPDQLAAVRSPTPADVFDRRVRRYSRTD